MRIAIDARFLSATGTGISSYVEGLISGIEEINLRHDDEFILFTPHRIKIYKQNIRSKIIDIPVVSLKQHVFMPVQISKIKPDLYHYPHFDLPINTNSPSIVTIHDLKYIKMPHLFHRKSKEKAFLIKLIMKNSIRRAQKVITVSQNTKEDIVNVLKVPPEKIVVVYEASAPYFRKLPNAMDFVSKKFKIHKPYILFVGEIRPHKNIQRLLEALAKTRNENLQLVVAGKSYKDYDEPFRTAEWSAIKDRVKFLKYIPTQDLVYLYNAAVAFILPSLYEGFGIPVVEAMACGTPVITSSISSLPEVAGNAALFVDPYDTECIANAIDKVASSSSLRKRLAIDGLKRAKLFSWARTAEESVSVYRSILQTR